MDLNGLLNRLAKLFIRQAMDAGIDYAARRGKPGPELTPQERQQATTARDLASRAKQLQKLTRRLWR